jgi:hypothetical protein
MLRSETRQQATNRVFAAKSLESMGPDARDALPALKSLRLDQSEQVRIAVRAAIAAIETDTK